MASGERRGEGVITSCMGLTLTCSRGWTGLGEPALNVFSFPAYFGRHCVPKGPSSSLSERRRLNFAQLVAAFLAKARSGSIAWLFISFRISEPFVRYEVLLEQTSFCLRLFDHGRARHDAHPAYQRVDADQSGNLRLVACESVRVELRSFVDELLVELLPPNFMLRESCGTVLTSLASAWLTRASSGPCHTTFAA